MVKTIILLVVAVLLASMAAGQTAPPLDVSIFYMSKCNQTRAFLQKSKLAAALVQLGPAIALPRINPAGLTPDAGSPFTVQSELGPLDVEYDAFIECAKIRTEDGGLSFLRCVNAETAGLKSFSEEVVDGCAFAAGLETEGLKECAYGFEGRQLLVEGMAMTDHECPGTCWVPIVMLGGDVACDSTKGCISMDWHHAICDKWQGHAPECNN